MKKCQARAQRQQRAHRFEAVVDFLDFFTPQKQQGPGVNGAQVHLVEQAVEQVRVLLQPAGNGLQGVFDLLLVPSADDHDHVFVLAELGQVVPPAFLALLVGTHQVVAAGAVLQVRPGQGNGQAGRHQSHGQDQFGMAADAVDKASQASVYDSWALLHLVLIHRSFRLF